MKKIITICLVLSSIFSVFSTNAFAHEYNTELTQTPNTCIIEEVSGFNNSDVTPLKAGLITGKYLKLSKTTDKLIISAKTTCTNDVDKCGFSYIKLQRLINGTWTDYSSFCYYDQFNESNSKTFEKSVNAVKGYTYRVVCEHYAEKSKLLVLKDKESIYNETPALVF